MNVGSVLRDRLTVLRPTRVSDGAGGHTNSYTSVGEAWGCLVASVSSAGREQAIGGSVTAAELYDVQLDVLETVPELRDRLRDEDGREFELLSLSRQGRYALGIAREVDAT